MARLHDFDLPATGPVTRIGGSCYFSLPLSGRTAQQAGLEFVVRTPGGEISFEWIADAAAPESGWVGNPTCLVDGAEPDQDAAFVRTYSGIKKLRYMPLSVAELSQLLAQMLVVRRRRLNNDEAISFRSAGANSSMQPETSW